MMSEYFCPFDGQKLRSIDDEQVDNFSDVYSCPSNHGWAIDGFHGPAYGFEVVEIRD